MQEQIIVSLTTYKPRICNLPIVLDSIYKQTILPDKVVLNLAYNEIIPQEVATYIKNHEIEVNFVEDTKVYKKLIPTLKKYPEACVINIDDDCLFPEYMIADFMDIHQKYPNNPISGNRVVYYGMQCHCGCCSLTKREYFGQYLDFIDKNCIENCNSSDIVMTFMANKNHHPYVRSKELYFHNIISNKLEVEPYSARHNSLISLSMEYLQTRFGKIDFDLNIYNYINDNYLAEIIADCFNNIYQEQARKYKNQEQARKLQEAKIEIQYLKNSRSYRLGHMIIYPLSIPLKIFRLIRDYNLLKKSGKFDSEYYLSNNEDVKKAKINPIMHYLRFGWKEGRNPSVDFDNKAYLSQRPEVKVAGICPLVHYLKFEKKE